MKVLVVLSVLIAIVSAGSLTPSELEILEKFDFETFLANKEQSQIIFDCMLEKGDCGNYKKLAELSLKTVLSNCADCTPTQKSKYDSVLKLLHDKYEPVYNELMKKLAAKKE